MRDPIQTLAEAIQRQQPAVLVTVIAVTGASPAKVGAQTVLRQCWLQITRLAGDYE